MPMSVAEEAPMRGVGVQSTRRDNRWRGGVCDGEVMACCSHDRRVRTVMASLPCCRRRRYWAMMNGGVTNGDMTAV